MWGSITANGLNSKMYKMGILIHHIVPWCGHVFQQDNFPVHTTGHVQNYLHRKEANVLPWPPASPDLSPIENLWALLKREIGVVHLGPGSTERKQDQLWNVIKETWEWLKGEARKATILQNYYGGMPWRIRELKGAKRGYTRH